MTPFNHLPGDTLTGLHKARSFARECNGPVSVIIAVPQHPTGLPAYKVARTFWSDTYEEVVYDRCKTSAHAWDGVKWWWE
jgi:hypothetical protein